MSAAPKRKWTPEEYLAQERRASFKSEYYAGEIFAIAGAAYPQNRAKDNLVIQIGMKLLGGPCQVLTSDTRVKVTPGGHYTYPDIVVVCGELKFEDDVLDTLLNPTVIFEVFSDSTEKYDRGAKFAKYRGLASLREYVLVAQDQPLIERFVRQANDSWVLTTFAGLEHELELATVKVRVPMVDVYRGVDLGEPGA